MRGVSGGSGSPGPEPRHRSSGTLGDARNQLRGSSYFKDINRPFTRPVLEQGLKFKCRSLQLVLVVVTCGTLLTLLRSPAMNHRDHSGADPRSRFVSAGRLWGRSISEDDRYVSHSLISWIQISKALEKLEGRNKNMRIGLLNFNATDVYKWQQLLLRRHRQADARVVHLDHAMSNITWANLYPEWIDEEEEFEAPTCPHLPRPRTSGDSHFDMIAVKLPCKKATDWSRDVARLHLQLAAAELAVASAEADGSMPVHALFVSDCFLIPNLFTCKDLVTREGNTWLYRPDLKKLREKLQLPIGSCKLALPLEGHEALSHSESSARREAFVTILHSSAHVYVCGAIAVAQSIRNAGSKRDLVVLVDDAISVHHRTGLEAAGWKVRVIQRIRNPKAEPKAYNEWNYSKFRLWQLTDYDKVVFVDADLLVLRNLDALFSMPEISATGNNATLFNSGVMVIEPSNCTFQLLMDHIGEIKSYNGGDQGYLNEVFTWWHRIPTRMNFLKHFWEGDEEEMKEKKTRLFEADPPVLYVLHYLGLKPWQCFRDYDCNWNVGLQREFASDGAHDRWWRAHDAMSEQLQGYCLLRSKQKASLEWDRRKAEEAGYPDGHWRRNITDTRRSICFEEFCFWESMLWHWGDPNWSDDKPGATTTTTALSGL